MVKNFNTVYAMKKVLCQIGMLAVAALAFVACKKEPAVELSKEDVITHIAKVTLTKGVETKTAVVEDGTTASYVWTEGDEAYLNIYECYNTTKETDEGTVVTKNHTKGTITDIQYSADHKTATLTVAFTGNPTGPYTYEAIYAKHVSSGYNPSIQSTQYPKVDNFDPAADVLISKATSDVTDVTERLTNLNFTLGRVVTVNKMTLTGLVAGETVQKVEFTLDKHMAGSYTISTGSYVSGGKKLTLDYTADGTSTGQTVREDGAFPVYFISAPVDAAKIESVVVTTDQHVYTKAGNTVETAPFYGKTITFAIGTMKRFTMAMDGYGEEISTGVEYTLVESADDLYDGASYLIAGSDVDVVMSLYTNGNNHPSVNAEKGVNAENKKTITIDNTIAAEPVVLKQVGTNWTIQNNVSGNTYFEQYLICDAGANNRLKETNSNTSALIEWTISVDNGVATIINANTDAQRTQMYCNVQTNNATIFNCYAPNQTDKNYHSLALYVDKTTCVELDESGLAYSVTSPIEVAWDNKENFVEPTLANPNNLTVTYSSSDETVATVDASTGDVTFVGNGTTTITASSARTSTYKAGVATYQITVTGAPAEKGSKDNPYTAAEARSAAIALAGEASSKEVYVKGIVSEITTEYSTKYNNVTFNISDDGLTTSDQFVAFREKSNYSSSVAAGDAVVVKGTIIYYNSATPEFQADNAIQSLLAKPVISGTENFTGSTSVNISAAEGSTIYYTTDGTEPNSSSSVYSAALNISATTTVKAIAVKDGLATGVAAKTFTKVATYAVTFETPSNGMIVVKHGETTLKTGDEIAEGETITITVTPSSGYVLSALVYNDGSDHDIKSVKSFTMPAHAVSITATFEESHGGTYSMTPDQSSTGSTATAYITTLTEFTYDEISWKMNQWNPSTLQIKTNQSSAASEFRFYNTSAFPGRIKKVVITFSALTVSDASKLMFLGGTSAVTATTGGTAGTWDATAKTLTWTPGASDNFTYFAFYQNGKAASGTNHLAESDAIVVEYE